MPVYGCLPAPQGYVECYPPDQVTFSETPKLGNSPIMPNNPLLPWEVLLRFSVAGTSAFSDGMCIPRCKGSGWHQPGAGYSALPAVCSFPSLSVCSTAVPSNNRFMGLLNTVQIHQ